MTSGESASRVNVERFWCRRESAYALDSDGFLRDPDADWFGRQSANPGVVRTDALSGQRCLALLGEPGAGKSTALKATSRLIAAGVPVQSVDLADYGSEETLVSEVFGHPSIHDWMAGTGQLCLVLDSLDEAQARVPHLGRVLANRIGRLPCERLFVRIACRTADWPAGLEQSLNKLFGEVAVVEILPLRRADAAAIAAVWCDPSRLLDEVARAGVGPLAARPLTLRFLARSFDHSEVLPGRGAELYTVGIRSMCDEQNPDRVDAGLGGALSLDQRVAVARRIAAATLFGGASAVWTGPEVAANSEDITTEQLTGSTEPTRSGTAALTVSAVLEALRTGLFTGRGEQRLGWAHATFADFLAAEWVVANQLSVAQARSLFLGPDGRCWPQTRLAAQWAVAIAPKRFQFLTMADPAAFQGEVELPDDQLRAAVIDGLFANASSLTALRWERSYHAFQHRDIAEQLRPRLHDADADRRRLALELADECAAAIELRDDLEAIASDITAEMPDRVAAGWALSRLEGQHRTAALRSLALNDDMRGDDPADEIKGVALLASWPQAMSTAEVFSVLTPRRRRNLHGSYAMFLGSFRAGITEVDIGDGLQWLLDDLNAPAEDHVLGSLANRVLTLAANRPTDPVVVEAFTRLVIARLEHYGGLLFEEFSHDGAPDPLADPVLRRAVATAVLDTDEASKLMQNDINLTSDYLGVVRAEDLGWLAELYTDVDGNKRDVVRSLFHMTFEASNAEHRELVLSMPRDHRLYVDLVHSWVDPVELGSSEADEMRRSWEMSHRPRPVSDETDDVNEQIEELLTRFDERDAMGFWYSTRLLTVAPGSKHFGAEFDPDVVGMKRWPTLSEGMRGRLVDAADRYLRSHPCQSEQWLHKPEIRHHPSEAGYRALVLLLRVAPERLHRLPAAVWIEWAPVLATWSTGLANGAKWDDKLQLLELAGAEARDAARVAMLTFVDAAVSSGRRPYVSNEASYLWDDTVAAKYVSLARSSVAEPLEEIVTSLTKHNFERLRELLLEWLEDPSDVERQNLAAKTLIDHDLERSWPAMRTLFDADLAFAEQALGRTLTVRGYEQVDHVPAAVLADIYLWLRASFPPESDPQFDDAHFVGPREEIGHWRDGILRQLQGEGSPEAVDAVRAILTALPDDRWLPRTLATAEAALRLNQWTPTPLPQLLQLARDRRTVLVNDPTGLTDAVVFALDEAQTRLTGATPESHYLWDTYAGRPKSEDEISDYLANELTRALSASGVIVNREVQVRRNRPSGIGERTDLLVDAAPLVGPDTGRLSLPVEVKGAWNAELRTAMRDQLVERYMSDTAVNVGIYVVAWPDLESWTDTADTRRQALASLDRHAVTAELAAQAAALTQEGARVRVVHLDIAYRRPTRGGPQPPVDNA